MNDAAEIAAMLGGKRVQRLAGGGYLIPCPVASHGKRRGDRNPSLSISDGEARLLVHCFAGCAPTDVLDALRQRGLVDSRTPRGNGARPPVAPKPERSDHERNQARKAGWLWAKRRPITATPAELYLRKARGITCALLPTLGFLPSYEEHAPALIAAFAIPTEPQPGILAVPSNIDSVHLIALKPDCTGKAENGKPKITIGSPGNMPIVLAPSNDLLALAVTEGIEDGLSVFESTGLGVWAAGTGGRMPALANVVPEYIEAVTIYAHADKTGRDGAHGLAEALIRRGIEVFIEGLR
jgi:Toprim domain